MTTCASCNDKARSVGVLCEPCRSRLASPTGLLPQQVYSSCDPGSEDVLVDQWGRPHPVATITIVGRSTARTGITILESGISREHARMTRENGVWRLRDLGSSNGTAVNGAPVVDCELRANDRIWFASIGFVFLPGLRAGAATPVPELGTRIQPTRPPGVEATSQRRVPIVILEPTGGGGGMIEIEQMRARLSASQLELVEVLAKRMLADSHQPEPVRGFVRSSELLGTLSWNVADPMESNIKQLVRRVRRRLMELGYGDLIEARRGFGYRLRLVPDELRRMSA